MLGKLLDMALSPVHDAVDLADGVLTGNTKKVAKAGTRLAIDAAIGFAAGKAIEKIADGNLLDELDLF